MTGPFAAHPGIHAVPREPSPLAQFFRRALRLVLRKQAVPEIPREVSGTALIADRYPCCVHCDRDEYGCYDPPSSHEEPCPHGCNDAPGGIVPAEGVLGDDMIADVRKQWNTWHDNTPVPTFTPRADTKPAGFPALTIAQQAAHADAMHGLSARYLPAPPRPVNGRSLPDRPRVYGQAAQLEVERDTAYAAGLRDRERYEPASHELLRQVLAGLVRL